MRWEDKHTYGLWGIGLGAVAMLFVLPFGFGWYTGGGAARQADAAASAALMPVCVDAILANPAAVAALATKRVQDYDDVVRDHLKTIGNRTLLEYTFRRDCGTAIAAKLLKQAAAK